MSDQIPKYKRIKRVQHAAHAAIFREADLLSEVLPEVPEPPLQFEGENAGANR